MKTKAEILSIKSTGDAVLVEVQYEYGAAWRPCMTATMHLPESMARHLRVGGRLALDVCVVRSKP